LSRKLEKTGTRGSIAAAMAGFLRNERLTLRKLRSHARAVTIKRLQQACEKHPGATGEIGAWIKIVKTARWRNFEELRASFPDANDVDGFVVFNVRHNRYRLIVAVHYAKLIKGWRTQGHVYIGSFLTHKEYDRWCGLPEKRRAEWLQF
jgi:mRNA interferase HigB